MVGIFHDSEILPISSLTFIGKSLTAKFFPRVTVHLPAKHFTCRNFIHNNMLTAVSLILSCFVPIALFKMTTDCSIVILYNKIFQTTVVWTAISCDIGGQD